MNRFDERIRAITGGWINRSNVAHAMVALAIQACVAMLWGGAAGWVVGAIAAASVFVGREHAQREYKIGDPSLLWGWEALDIWRWSNDARMDLILPLLSVAFVALIASFIR